MKSWSRLRVKVSLHTENLEFSNGTVRIAMVPGQTVRAQYQCGDQIISCIARLRLIRTYKLHGITLRKEVSLIHYADYYLTRNGQPAKFCDDVKDGDVIILSKPARGC